MIVRYQGCEVSRVTRDGWMVAVAIANEARLRGVGYTELVGMLSEVFSRAKADFS